MVTWGPTIATVSTRILRGERRTAPVIRGERPECLVAVRPYRHGRVYRTGSFVCALYRSFHGTYFCPVTADGGPTLRKNAEIDNHGVLHLTLSLRGTHATRPLAWQRYPHVNGHIHPWTSAGRLRAGLRLVGHHSGSCYHGVDGDPDPAAFTCLAPSKAIQWGPCFVHRDIAACAGAIPTEFTRWRITARG